MEKEQFSLKQKKEMYEVILEDFSLKCDDYETRSDLNENIHDFIYEQYLEVCRSLDKKEKEIKERELDNMITFYNGDYLSKINNEQSSFIQAFNEKTEIHICYDCMVKGEFYCDGEGKIACKHNYEGLLEQFREKQKEIAIAFENKRKELNSKSEQQKEEEVIEDMLEYLCEDQIDKIEDLDIAFKEAIENNYSINVCEDCMKNKEVYINIGNELLCKHNMDSYLPSFREMNEEEED